MDNTAILEKVEEHVTNLFQTSPGSKLVYHNLEHTQKVVAKTKEIAGNYNLVENDLLVLHVAAWFHDTGYLFAEPAVHEEKSVQLMKDLMKEMTTEENLLDNIEQCILATKSNAKPSNLLQQILADADTYNLGTKEFTATNEQIYKEYILRNGYMSKNEWDRQTLKFVENHCFYTTYCKELLTEGKKKNIRKMRENIAEKKEDGTTAL